jgi:hypothetical protein
MSFGDVEVPLLYLKRLEIFKREKPFEIFMRIPANAPDQRNKNTEFEPSLTRIYDIRGHEGHFNLDDHGFAVRRFDAKLPPIEAVKHEYLKGQYFPEVEQFIRGEIEGVDQVCFFGFRVPRPYYELSARH